MWTAESKYTTEAHLAQMSAVLGDMPRRLLDRSKNRGRYFDVGGTDVSLGVLGKAVTDIYRPPPSTFNLPVVFTGTVL